MPFEMHVSDAFMKQKRACDAYKNPAIGTKAGTPKALEHSVYLIYRVNGDDSTLSTIFSQTYLENPSLTSGPGSISPALRGNSGEKIGKGKVAYETITKTAKLQGGGHAEEIFIRSLDKIASDLEAMSYTIKRFEIFTSKIPCCKNGNVGSSAFMLGETLFKEGCGHKMCQLAQMRGDIQWDLCYETDYEGHGEVHSQTIEQMLKFQKLANASVVRFVGSGVVKQISHV